MALALIFNLNILMSNISAVLQYLFTAYHAKIRKSNKFEKRYFLNCLVNITRLHRVDYFERKP